MFPSNEKSKSEKSKNGKQSKDIKEVKNGKGKEQEKHGILKRDTG